MYVRVWLENTDRFDEQISGKWDKKKYGKMNIL